MRLRLAPEAADNPVGALLEALAAVALKGINHG